MIFENFNQYKSSAFTPTVCIIGSGPAGISLALKLEKLGIPSLIVEAGGFEYSTSSQEPYKGNVIGDEYAPLDAARLRHLGGTSGHWGGWCFPLDEADFEQRDGFPNSGWPIKKEHLDPFSQETCQILGVAPFPPNIKHSEHIQEVTFRFSKVRFGEKYKEEIKKSKLIGLLINSPLHSLVPNKSAISHINIQSKNKIKTIKAKYFSLCTGGIENSRMLLWSNQLSNDRVVPENKSLGKYWMEHPHFNIGESVMFQSSKLHRDISETTYPINFFAPTTRFLRENGVGNFALRVEIIQSDPKRLVKDMLCSAGNIFSNIADKDLVPNFCARTIKVAWGQTPLRSNRIELSKSEKDSMGIPRVNLYWKKEAQDRVTAQASIKLLGTYLVNSDIGRAKVSSWLTNDEDYPSDDEKFGYHHMGGTRMASTKETGVVDMNCKVFGMDNLFVGGSSVFATAGHANPTYTIVQLALRLGDYIAKLDSKS